MKEEPHSRNLRLHRQMAESGIFFITKSLWPKRPVLIETGAADEVVKSLRFSVEQKRIVLASFAVMPDHWHALFAVLPPLTLPMLMKRLDSWIGRQSKSVLAGVGTAWEAGYYDTHVRTNRQFRYVCSYIEENPVRKELANTPEEWRWSSAHPDNACMLVKPWPFELVNESH